MGGIGEVAYRLKNTECRIHDAIKRLLSPTSSQESVFRPRNKAMNSVTKLYKNMCYTTAHKFQ